MAKIYKRIQQVMDVQQLSISALARILGENVQRIRDIQNGRQRVPEDVLIKITEIFHVNGTWLLTGKGEMYDKKTIETIEDIETSEKTIEWLIQWWENADKKHKIWLEVQMKHYFPDYAAWLAEEEKK